MERLVYRSRALWPDPETAMDDILRDSLWNNARGRITGALGFSGRTYVQLLEGPTASLDDLLAKLAADPRHTDLTILVRAPVSGRLVPGWTMARADLAAASPRVTDLLTSGDGLALAALLANLVHQGETGVA
ncbi:hypothetical protein GGQ87_002993 [Brevundimonas alba]|uniref:BLUF domain-containing protein n=1 Tax=Brevundimonas alba TaxID=74314 RepID=A0A7X6BNZ1_9CAUL|nr:BLUF domain-containing protein [Brevundimonas alba]NJC42698.1 hypothetical protein [Brevundimonas alba]